jgi:Fe-S-cluster-containing dehydrogenase component
MRWGMVIDLKKCVGCYSCVVSCKEEHFLPPGIFFNKVLITHVGKYPAVTKEILPILCNHCKEVPCVKVCPTGASTQREDGIVQIDYDKCMGCRYCVVVCPYQHRSYFKEYKEYFAGQGYTPPEELGRKLKPLQEGTAVKCTFCADRIDEGLKKGLRPGEDFEATPACVIACPAKARYFGNLEDPESEVSRLIREKKGTQLCPEYDTDPSVYYLRY